jgi:hypothetical protein
MSYHVNRVQCCAEQTMAQTNFGHSKQQSLLWQTAKTLATLGTWPVAMSRSRHRRTIPAVTTLLNVGQTNALVMFWMFLARIIGWNRF